MLEGLMTGTRGVCIYVLMYVCIMYKEEGRNCDELRGTAVFFFCVSMRYVSVM